jgi:hypothetical protein
MFVSRGRLVALVVLVLAVVAGVADILGFLSCGGKEDISSKKVDSRDKTLHPRPNVKVSQAQLLFCARNVAKIRLAKNLGGSRMRDPSTM